MGYDESGGVHLQEEGLGHRQSQTLRIDWKHVAHVIGVSMKIKCSKRLFAVRNVPCATRKSGDLILLSRNTLLRIVSNIGLGDKAVNPVDRGAVQ